MARAVRYHRLSTEQRNPRTRALDRRSTLEVLRLMHREDRRAVQAVRHAMPEIARATDLIAHALRRGGRLVFVGAGTSGRLGVLEAAECPPTFHTEASRVRAIIAGGSRAVFRSREGAEDHRPSARASVRREVRPGDVVVGLSASGVTAFVDEAVKTARARRAATILVTCNPHAAPSAHICIRLATGPEVLAGSTRLKAGTATKLVLNMLTLGAMVQCGKTYDNLMVDVRPSSRKLAERAVRLIQLLAPCPAPAARQALRGARGHTKAAILMVAGSLTYAAARRALARAGGSLRLALHRLPRRPHPDRRSTDRRRRAARAIGGRVAAAIRP